MSKDTIKNIAKKGSKAAMDKATQGSGKSLNDEYGVGDAAKDIAKGAKDVTNGAKSTAKLASKAAAGNYAGAIMEFLKNPKGILTVVITPILIFSIIITCVMGVLTKQIWNVITDGTEVSLVDEYVEEMNKIEKNSFSPAYSAVVEKILTDISGQVKELNEDEIGGSNFTNGRNSIFKDKDSIRDNLGQAYRQMRNFTANGNKYTSYECIKSGTATILPIFEDSSTGFDEVSMVRHEIENDSNSKASGEDILTNSALQTTWTRVVRLIDFAEKSNSSKTLNNQNKTMYTFIYNNAKYNEDGISMSMFETIYNQVYDYNHYNNINSDNETTKLISSYIKVMKKLLSDNKQKLNKSQLKEFTNNISLMKSNYSLLGMDAYYLDSSIISEANQCIDIYNTLAKKEEDKKEKHIDENVSELLKKINNDKKDEFIKFMSKKEVYENLLSYNINIKSDNYDEKYNIPQYNTGTDENPNNAGFDILNIKKEITISINVELCDYDELAKIFGFYDENGKENNGLINWINNSSNKLTENNDGKQNTNKDDNLTNIDGKYIFMAPVKLDSRNYIKNSDKNGMTIKTTYNKNVVASVSGKVVTSKYSAEDGNYIVIESKLKKKSGDVVSVKTIYSHLRERYAFVENEVKQGNIIGTVGSSGNSIDYKLGFKVCVDDKFINPKKVLCDEGCGALTYKETKNENIMGVYYFFEESKDAGNATAALLIDAGYVKSSTFWQFKMNVFNVLFNANVTDGYKLPFFVDINNIARDEKGNLKIVEYDNAYYDTSTLDEEKGDIKYNKKYYAVYCKPGTIITYNMAGQVNNASFGKHYGNGFWTKTGNIISNLWNKLTGITSPLGSKGGYNVRINMLEDSRKELSDKSRKLDVPTSISKNGYYNSELPFTQATYYISTVNGGYGFDICNVQISASDDANDNNERLLIGADFINNNYGQWYGGTNTVGITQTITEKIKDNEESDFEINNCILGAVPGEEYIVDGQYEVDDSSTYPYFIIAASNTQADSKIKIDDKSCDIYSLFDLSITADEVYSDEASGIAWPLIKAYEHDVNLKTVNLEGIIYQILDDSIVIKNKSGKFFRITNIIANPDLNEGDEISANSTEFGTPVTGAQISLFEMKASGSDLINGSAINSASQLKPVLTISARSDTNLGEDGIGEYNKLVAMMNGRVEEVSENSITVYSEEQNLYYEYSGVTISEEITKGYLVGYGEVIGKLYCFDENGETNSMEVVIYQKNYTIGTGVQTLYFNPSDYFPNIQKNIEATRSVRILYKKQEITGKMLNLNSEITLSCKKTTLNSKDTDVVWSTSDSNIVSIVNSDNKECIIRAIGYGSVKINCSFKNGEALNASCDIIVPEHVINFNVNYKTSEKGTKYNVFDFSDHSSDGEVFNDNGWPYVKVPLLKANNGTYSGYLKFTAALDSGSKATNAFTYTVTDQNGNPSNYVTVNKKGLIKTNGNARGMEKDEYLLLTITPTIKAGELEEAQQPMTIKIQFYKKIESINWKSSEVIELYNNVDSLKTKIFTAGTDFEVLPSDATYKAIKCQTTDRNIAVSENIGNNGTSFKLTAISNTAGDSTTCYISTNDSFAPKYNNIKSSLRNIIVCSKINSFDIELTRLSGEMTSKTESIGKEKEIIVIEGESVQLNTKVDPNIGGASITVNSDNSKIATVSNNLSVTGIKEGTCNVSITVDGKGNSNNKTNTYVVRVIPKIKLGIKWNKISSGYDYFYDTNNDGIICEPVDNSSGYYTGPKTYDIYSIRLQDDDNASSYYIEPKGCSLTDEYDGCFTVDANGSQYSVIISMSYYSKQNKHGYKYSKTFTVMPK